MEAVLTPEGAQIVIRLDLKAIQALQLDVDSVSVAHAIAAGKLHLKMEHILYGPTTRHGPELCSCMLRVWTMLLACTGDCLVPCSPLVPAWRCISQNLHSRALWMLGCALSLQVAREAEHC